MNFQFQNGEFIVAYVGCTVGGYICVGQNLLLTDF